MQLKVHCITSRIIRFLTVQKSYSRTAKLYFSYEKSHITLPRELHTCLRFRYFFLTKIILIKIYICILFIYRPISYAVYLYPNPEVESTENIQVQNCHWNRLHSFSLNYGHILGITQTYICVFLTIHRCNNFFFVPFGKKKNNRKKC